MAAAGSRSLFRACTVRLAYKAVWQGVRGVAPSCHSCSEGSTSASGYGRASHEPKAGLEQAVASWEKAGRVEILWSMPWVTRS